MKVTGWTWSENPDYPVIDRRNIDDANFPYSWDEMWDLIARELRKKGYRFTGSYHQEGDYGAPVIDGKYQLLYSCREWGDIMEEAYQEHPGDYFAYCKWAWIEPEGEKMCVPDPADYEEGDENGF